MYPLGLSAAEKRLYTLALSGNNGDPTQDPDVPTPNDPEGPDDPKGGGDTPTPPVADPGGNPMQYVTANIANGMSSSRKAEDFETVKGLGSIILFQEIREGASQAVLRHHFPVKDWYILPTSIHRTDKIVIKRSLWNVEQVGSYYMSPKPPVQGRPRYCNVALVTLKGTGIQFLVHDTHYVAYAWSNHKIADKAIRKVYWNRHYNRQQNLLLDVRGKGITSIGGGDYNRGSSGLNKFHSSQVWFRQGNLDHLFGIPAPGGAQFNLLSSQTVSLNSDHNALVAKLSWTAGSNSLRSGYNWGGA